MIILTIVIPGASSETEWRSTRSSLSKAPFGGQAQSQILKPWIQKMFNDSFWGSSPNLNRASRKCSMVRSGGKVPIPNHYTVVPENQHRVSFRLRTASNVPPLNWHFGKLPCGIHTDIKLGSESWHLDICQESLKRVQIEDHFLVK